MQYDKVQSATLRDAEVAVAVWEWFDLTGWRVAAARIPSEQAVTKVGDCHLDLFARPREPTCRWQQEASAPGRGSAVARHASFAGTASTNPTDRVPLYSLLPSL